MDMKTKPKGRNGLINVGAYLPPATVARIDALCAKMFTKSRRVVIEQLLNRYLPEMEIQYGIAPPKSNCDYGKHCEDNPRKTEADRKAEADFAYAADLSRRAMKLADSLPPQAASQKQERFSRADSDRVRK